jgi:plasmid stabilization system protein ParE
MSTPIAYLPEAEDDIVSTYEWYEHQLPGLGDRFLEALHKTAERISDNPQLYGILRRDIRAAVLRRFPYVVYYRIRTDDVLIIAVQHGHRSSRAWRGRA